MNSSLGQDAVVKGYIHYPIKDYIQKTAWDDQIDVQSCNFAKQVDDANYLNSDLYDWLARGTEKVYQQDFGLTDE